uniref:Integrase catalytic domain-containing protein n=1 Tax=Nothobranchius furzeri TaxID=105023 RepID=A0A8C6VTM3_NOTFU
VLSLRTTCTRGVKHAARGPDQARAQFKSEAASLLSVSRQTFYILLKDHNIPASKYVSISDEQLDTIISQIKTGHPNIGEVMLMGHLRSRDIVVQRRRLRESLHRVDPVGIQSRRRSSVVRRVYSVPHPNFIWHIDGNHKLIRWKFVVHAAIDGYSRTPMFLHCSNNNRAETVKDLFTVAVGHFGRPLHIRTDHGGENVRIWEDMQSTRGESSVLTGSSVHNQRIEHLNNNCSKVYAPTFYALESLGCLNLQNPKDLFCLHYVYLPRINHTLEEFKAAYNNHSISSEGNKTPVQLFSLNSFWLHNPQQSARDVLSVSDQSEFMPLTNMEMDICVQMVLNKEPVQQGSSSSIHHHLLLFLHSQKAEVNLHMCVQWEEF